MKRRPEIVIFVVTAILISTGVFKSGWSQTASDNFDWTYNSSDFGVRIAGIQDIWWSGSAYKIGQNRKVPSSKDTDNKVSLQLAGNEYEAVQVVVNSPVDLRNVTVKATDLIRQGNNKKLASSNITIDRVEYVRTTVATDSSTIAGFWPDPLVPVEKSVNLKAGINHPFWVTVFAPKNTEGGIYTGQLLFSGDNWSRTIPFEVRVWGFSLTDERHLKTALGLSNGNIAAYHNVAGAELESVIDLYYDNLSRHRISPYDPAYGAGIHVDWGIDENQNQVTPGQVKIDFSEFDRGMEKSIEKYHFNTVKIPIQGVGRHGYAGTMYYPGIIGPYTQDTEEYNILFGSYLRQLQDHLEKKGWLDIAYLYWYDEPTFLVYKELREMGDIIKRYAPRLKWMLTDKITLDLVGPVDIWNPVLHNFQRDTSLIAQAAGYKMWWYICTVPKAPYVGEFIDHAAIEPRLWIWQTWEHKVQGILIWNINYWTNSVVYDGKLQNPWTDPESWWSGRAGSRWGNGDGRFLYPPNRDPNNNKKPFISGPLNSIRWELLRDGIEDYEYFWTLNSQLNQMVVKNANFGLNAEELQWEKTARELLIVPESVSKSLTDFSKNPKYLMEHRTKLAEIIERGTELLKG